MDAAFIPEQAALLGTWDVSKTYLHLYDENAVRLELNQPLDGFGGRTALEVASDAYLKHVSQQWCWFYVSDTYQYSCAKFGLYRTTVGVDTVTGYEGGEGANMLEHISISDSKNEAASNPYDDASNQKNEVSDNKSEDLSPETSTPVTSGNSNDSIVNNSRTAAALIVLMAMILLLILMLSLVVMLNHKRNRKKR
jgi:hypothetical protein